MPTGSSVLPPLQRSQHLNPTAVEREAAEFALSLPLDEVLGTYPSFRAAVEQLDELRLRRLHAAWGSSRLLPLVVRSLRQGKFKGRRGSAASAESSRWKQSGIDKVYGKHHRQPPYVPSMDLNDSNRRRELLALKLRGELGRSSPEQQRSAEARDMRGRLLLVPAMRRRALQKAQYRPLPPAVFPRDAPLDWYETLYMTEYQTGDDAHFDDILNRHLEDCNRNLLSVRNQDEMQRRIDRMEEKRRARTTTPDVGFVLPATVPSTRSGSRLSTRLPSRVPSTCGGS